MAEKTHQIPAQPKKRKKYVRRKPKSEDKRITRKRASHLPGGGAPGPGRPKGSIGQSAIKAKEAFQLAFQGLGGVPALIKWGMRNKTEFYRLYSRLIPHELVGGDGKELKMGFIDAVSKVEDVEVISSTPTPKQIQILQ